MDRARPQQTRLFFLDAIGDLKPAQPGTATCDGEPKIEGTPTPGATLTWTPPTVKDRCDWAVLVSESRDVVVQSEPGKGTRVTLLLPAAVPVRPLKLKEALKTTI